MPVTLAEPLNGLAAHLQCALTQAERSALSRFAHLVAQWNRKVDLTSAQSDAQLVEILVADALVLRDPALIGPKQQVVDVGSGAGAPALPLALLRPDLELHCVEPMRKRVAFLRTAVGTLGLAQRVKVHQGRIETLDVLPQAGVAMSRATFAPATWAALGATLAQTVLVLTAKEPAPQVQGLCQVAFRHYTLPRTSAERRITAYRVIGVDGHPGAAEPE